MKMITDEKIRIGKITEIHNRSMSLRDAVGVLVYIGLPFSIAFGLIFSCFG